MENLRQVEDVQEVKYVLDPLAPMLQSAEKQNFVNQVRESHYQICVLMIIYNLYDSYNISMNEIILNGFFLLETCFNKKKDNGEEGVDCGGPCRLKCVGMRFLNPFYDSF